MNHQPEQLSAGMDGELTGEELRFLLRGLDPAAKYEVTDLDRPGQLRMSGRELMGKGLKLSLAASPGSALILYSRAGGGQ